MNLSKGKEECVMKKRCSIVILLLLMILLTSCRNEEQKLSQNSYLSHFINERESIIRGIYLLDGEELTKEDIYYNIRGDSIDFSLEDYIFEEPKENAEKYLVWKVMPIQQGKPYFYVYRTSNMVFITGSREFIAQEIEEKKALDEYNPLTYSCGIGYYDIGKAEIREEIPEYTQKAERAIQEILPYVSFEDYEKQIFYGDNGDTIYRYYSKEKYDETKNFAWISSMRDTYIVITISDREFLDSLLYGEEDMPK